jgi:HTH-type transcriptional repressor of NAD biosynthesis genes
MNGHGLVMGKFYPPHVGHHDLIRLAAEECERVTVVVVAASVESIPVADRVGWIREEHSSESNVAVVGAMCDSSVDVTSEVVWRAQIAVVRAALRTVTVAPVDVVYSAEDYGDELAARLDAKHVRVGRIAQAPSSTAVRRDLVSTWSTLAPATRAGLATRVIVVGGESTGTTTVSRAVADRFRSRGGGLGLHRVRARVRPRVHRGKVGSGAVSGSLGGTV